MDPRKKAKLNRRPASPVKKIICGFPYKVDVRDNPNVKIIDEHMDYIERETEINNFLRDNTTVPGDIVTYAGPAQGDAWTAIVQMNNYNKKCLGDRRYLVDDYEGYSSDDSVSSTDPSFIDDSDTEGGRKSKKRKSKKRKSQKRKSQKRL